jgi:N-methylhydantoinase A/oxoprolinase/acetone carboxylase beta subunit
VLARAGLKPGAVHDGPLIVESPDTTVVVPPAWRLRAEPGGLLALEKTHA